MFLIKNRFFLLSVLSFASCGGTSKRNKDPETGGPERRGVTVALIDLKFFDSQPSVSSDGEKVAFISGRSGNRRAFIKTVASDTEASRIFSDETDLGEEIEVVIAPNGSFAVILTSDGDNFSVFLQKLDSSKPVEVSKDSFRKSDIGISPDSKYVSFAKSGENSAKEIFIGKVATDLKTVTVQKLGATNNIYSPRWSSSLPNQQLLAYRKSENIGQTDVLKYSFTTDQQTSNLEPEVMGSVVLGEQEVLVGSDNYAFFIKDAYNQEKIKTRSSTGNAETLDQVNVLNEAERITIADSTSQTLETSGFRIRDIAANSTGELATLVTQERISCKDKDSRYGSALFTYQAGSDEMILQLPYLEKDSSEWKLENESICLQTEEGKDQYKIDDRISMSVVNGDATDSNYTIVYVTQFSTDNSSLGDREIRALRVAGNDINFYEISKNPKSK